MNHKNNHFLNKLRLLLVCLSKLKCLSLNKTLSKVKAEAEFLLALSLNRSIKFIDSLLTTIENHKFCGKTKLCRPISKSSLAWP